MVKAIRIYEYGGPEVFKWEDIEIGDPGSDEVRIRQSAIGLNFRDVYHRDGSYGVPDNKFPAIIGGEASGVIEAVGSDVKGFKTGQRVVYTTGPMGAYTQARNVKAEHVLLLPEAIDDQVAAAMMVKGTTAQYLLRSTYRVQPGDTILVHAAAGGVGLIMCQWGKLLGATVIGTVSSDEKAELAKANGCDHTIIYTREDFAKRVLEITDGVGVPVVYDGVGKDTCEGSLDSLRTRGILVGYGNASGNFPLIDPLDLMHRGSLYFTRTSGRSYIYDRQSLEDVTGELFDLVGSGKIKINISQTYPLKEAVQAHIDLEARKTTGSVVLQP